MKDIDYEEFNRNDMLQDALIRQIEIIGEASSRISEVIREKYNEISWVDIKAMRNKLIHVTQYIPVLKNQIIKILSDINPQIPLKYQ